VGKSTVFNALTGLRQHTGNWPGKTVARAEGGFAFENARHKLIDLPGTYSLLAASTDEEIARDFILFGRPDVTVIVVDATRLERNLNLVMQVLEITDRAVVCLNLIDEAERTGLAVDARALARELGVPVVATAARERRGIDELTRTIAEVASGKLVGRPRRLERPPRALREAITQMADELSRLHPALPNTRWVAIRLDHDPGERGDLPVGRDAEKLIRLASKLRWQIGTDFHQALMETIYAAAARIADQVVSRDGSPARFQLGRAAPSTGWSRTASSASPSCSRC
jgi:ferrous iron transport protein B